MGELSREDFSEGIKAIADKIPQPRKAPVSFASVMSSVAVAGLIGMFNYVTTQTQTNTRLQQDLQAITTRVDENAQYIKIHEPTIEHRDTRQCGHMNKHSLAIANIHNAVSMISEQKYNLTDVPFLDCGPGAGR